MTEHDLFPEEAPAPDATRRSFLKMVGFGFASATVAGCSRGPVLKAIPYLVPPEEIVPGRTYRIATTCAGCTASCGALALCKDGRPIKLEGNAQQAWTGGGLCAVGQASILSLYDSQRLDGAAAGSDAIAWKDADTRVRRHLEEVRGKGGRVRLLTRTITSPSTRSTIERFLARFEDGRHVMVDPLSVSALLDAHEKTHGVRVLPRIRFERAKVIAAFDADFLGTWISPVEYTRGYAEGRNPDAGSPRFSRHVHFEARMSLTGGQADERVLLAPWEMGPAIERLDELVGNRLGGGSAPLRESSLPPSVEQALIRLADDLVAHRGESLVVCGSNELGAQTLVNRINHRLGSYGTTLDLVRPSLQRAGSDRDLRRLLEEMKEGSVDLLIVQGVNPAYDLPPEAGFDAAAEGVGLVVRLASHRDETGARSHLLVAERHFLESWNDAEPHRGFFTMTQPTVPPLKSGRTLRECLARWMGDLREDRELLVDHWRKAIWPTVDRGSFPSFDRFFDRVLHDGHHEAGGAVPRDGNTAFRPDQVLAPAADEPPSADSLGLVLYPRVGMLDGSHAHNPWLHELPDPVSKVAWENHACLAPATAKKLDVESGDLIRLSDGPGRKLELPVQIQPGQHPGVVAVALGYGRMGTDRFQNVGPRWLQSRATVAANELVGKNAAPFLDLTDTSLRSDTARVRVSRGEGRVELASSQGYHSLTVPPHLAPRGGEVRDAARSLALADLMGESAASTVEAGHPEESKGLWSRDHEAAGPRWGLAIDLNACTGCSACVISCQAENNVPVVGEDEVRRHREMHWIRIDRYYQEHEGGVEALHQPMMCQHCENAPCETVCPVLATVHGKEGLNQQVYNRCLGTRYCANNCPYKVRRFNWFDYPREDRLQNMALNPDVTIRSRGVMEKCSMCIQRIQEAKADARRRGVELEDGAIEVACQQSCPASAIVFGDLNDPESRVSRAVASPRAYTVLPELNVRPGVHYLAAVRNRGEPGNHDPRSGGD